MLHVLQMKSLTNTLAVVTRYFGGIKLGAGGLTRAYGGAAGAARRVGTDTGKEADHRNRKAGTPGDGTSDNAVKPASGQKDGGGKS